MYEYIVGKVALVKSNYIVLDNNNIGYAIYVANPYSYHIDNEYKVYIYTQIKEDEHLLYGFGKEEEKELFLSLINVKGLGPKLAMVILSHGDISYVKEAIEKEDISYLKKFPKVGDKVARQIILDLKGKLAKGDTKYDEHQELISVLENLGYKSVDIKRILPNISKNIEIEQQVKEALKLMIK